MDAYIENIYDAEEEAIGTFSILIDTLEELDEDMADSCREMMLELKERHKETAHELAEQEAAEAAWMESEYRRSVL